MEPRITVITLGVKDLQRSYEFYKNGLGFPTSSSPEQEMVIFETSGTRIALFPLQSLADDVAPGLQIHCGCFPGITLIHNTRSRDEVDAVLALAESVGGKIVKQAQIAEWGGYSGYFSDPDGYLWEVAWWAENVFNDDGSLVL